MKAINFSYEQKHILLSLFCFCVVARVSKLERVKNCIYCFFLISQELICTTKISFCANITTTNSNFFAFQALSYVPALEIVGIASIFFFFSISLLPTNLHATGIQHFESEYQSYKKIPTKIVLLICGFKVNRFREKTSQAFYVQRY